MKRERISQLLDAELEASEIEMAIDDLLGSQELQKSWRLQYSMRATMRESGGHAPVDLVDRVSAALEGEATVFAPDNLSEYRPSESSSAINTGNVVPILTPTRPRRVLAYAAIAASVAALVLFAYQPRQAQTNHVAAVQNAGKEAMQPELQAMIVQHGEFSGTVALNGLVAYAKVVNASSGAKY